MNTIHQTCLNFHIFHFPSQKRLLLANDVFQTSLISAKRKIRRTGWSEHFYPCVQGLAERYPNPCPIPCPAQLSYPPTSFKKGVSPQNRVCYFPDRHECLSSFFLNPRERLSVKLGWSDCRHNLSLTHHLYRKATGRGMQQPSVPATIPGTRERTRPEGAGCCTRLVPVTFLTAWTLLDRYSRHPRYPLPSQALVLERSGARACLFTFAGHAPGPARPARRPRGLQWGAAFPSMQRHLVACSAHCGFPEPFWDALLGADLRIEPGQSYLDSNSHPQLPYRVN